MGSIGQSGLTVSIITVAENKQADNSWQTIAGILSGRLKVSILYWALDWLRGLNVVNVIGERLNIFLFFFTSHRESLVYLHLWIKFSADRFTE